MPITQADNIEWVETDALLLDPDNPRLAEFRSQVPEGEQAYTPEGQRALLVLLWDVMDVGEVAESIASNGYFTYEAVFAEPKDNRWVVVEGNRRVAAVKALRMDARRRRDCGLPPVAEATTDALATLERLPVLVGGRDDIWQYMGYKHVHGAQPWSSLSKAEYIDYLYRQRGVGLAEIARRIGDRRATVERIYRGYSVLRQAEQEARVFRREDCSAPRGFSFSHLYTAVHRTGFQRYLGLDRDDMEHPVPPDRFDELSNVMLWLYGSQDRGMAPAVRTQNPDLQRLDTVLVSDRATVALVRDTSVSPSPDLREALANALDRTQTPHEHIVGALDSALAALREAHGWAEMGPELRDDALMLARDVVRVGQSLVTRLEQAQPSGRSHPALDGGGDGLGV